MRVLLVEDDRMIGDAVYAALKDAAYAADWVRDGEQALQSLATHSYDLVLLDLGLPRRDGVEVLRQLRQQGNQVPLLIVTARDALEDRLKGLDAGADDYVLKPFAMSELLARARAVMRRKAGNASPLMSNGMLSLDPATRQVCHLARDEAHTLSGREYALLQALLAQPGQIFSRGELESKIYGWGEEIESNAIEYFIHSLRKKLGSDAIQKCARRGMESLKRRLSESVQLRLSLVLCVAVGSIALLSGVLGFLSAWDEAHELQDSSLQQIASLAKEGMLTPRSSNFISPPLQDEAASRILVHFTFPAAAPSADFPLPAHPEPGFHTLNIHQRSYRVLIEDMPGGVQVAVAQLASVRESVALSSALRTLVPFGILFPVLLYLVADLVKKIFRPIHQLAAEVDQQRDSALVSLDSASIPREIRPFIKAINRLLQRSSDSLALQRRFVADAAHELRSPLTALMLQAERLGGSELPQESQQRLRALRSGMERATWLVEQLLTLSRAQSGEAVALPAIERTSVFTVVKQVISDLHPLAEEKKLDLGVLNASDAEVMARPADLYTVLRNLLHNAIQYTPSGGCIDVAIERHASRVLITVEDSGPGIPTDKHQRVFDAFYRIEGSDANGSGLGLSIVSAMLMRMQGEVTLSAATRFSSGLQVRVCLPTV